ncbi:UNVERIFIED_CONTAM: hypothetical protein PYX00_003383 [Menopon gallinae]|uniref:Uncharacterized protein n=1 Tax=Menopon gallinae TaxID=328185 RepID=A0AAW2I092_9NEOP
MQTVADFWSSSTSICDSDGHLSLSMLLRIYPNRFVKRPLVLLWRKQQCGFHRWKQDLAVVEWNLHWDTPTADGSLYSSKINVEGRLTIGGWLHECLHVVSSTKLKSAGVDISSGTVVGPYTTPTSPTAQQQLTSWKS